MCGRIALSLPQDMALFFDASASHLPPQEPRWNMCPTQMIPVAVAQAGQRSLEWMRWGFLPHWYKTPNDGPLIINARSEGIAEKPAFRTACRERRCLIPVSGFYEWTIAPDKGRDPWFMQPQNGGLMAFGGVWQSWTGPDGQVQQTVAVVTCEANKPMSVLHHRMPVMIAPQDFPLWLGEAGHGASTLMRPAPDDMLNFRRVSRKVNGARYDNATLIESFVADPA
jgi:putative SOS response-associated peptidase YedK